MKKILCLLFAVTLLLCSCQKPDSPVPNQGETTTVSTTRVTITREPTAQGDGTSSLQTESTTHDSSGKSSSSNSTTHSKPTVTTSNTTTVTTSRITGSKPTQASTNSCAHTDDDNNGICDVCQISVLVTFDFYGINDLHGKFADTTDNVGVDELTTYLRNARQNNHNSFFVSAGDMWQGSAESNMTKGHIITMWMNELGFVGSAIGNHEFDWGEEYIASNAEIADFPLLAINIYDRKTNSLSDFCKPSAMIDSDGVQIGIIGAIGDCYSSIAVEQCDEVYFKVGHELTNLVKAEADRLKQAGADFIIYLLHDGYGRSTSGSVSGSQLASYYDPSLSNGYIDLVFEGHTHQSYRQVDEYGVYHLQNRGDNKGGISHAKVDINIANSSKSVQVAELISTNAYQMLSDDPIVEDLLEKYKDVIAPANRVLGYNNYYRSGEFLQEIIARLYYEVGENTWGDDYQIVLGGGFMSVRSPYNLYAGEVTYAQLQALFPFDNQITLCSVKGSYLLSKFLKTNNDRYFIYCGDYGESIRDNIDPNATYYLITDSYTAYYGPNKLTVIDKYDPTVFARDLLAEYIEDGGLS